MADTEITWTPLAQRDFATFQKIALETEDPTKRDDLYLKAGSLLDKLMGEIIRVGYLPDSGRLALAVETYEGLLRGGLEVGLRKQVFHHVKAYTEQAGIDASTLLPFVISEPDRGITSGAVLDFVSLGELADGADPLQLPRAVLSMIELREPANRGAAFGGLIATGEPRVCDLLWTARTLLNEDEINEVCLCQTGFICKASVEFFLDWLEEIVHKGRDSLFGKLASALALIRRDKQSDYVMTGQRPFPFKSAQGQELLAMSKFVPLDDFARQIAPRMLKLTEDEPDPKVMPDVLAIWGICTMRDARGPLIVDDLTERCWEGLQDKSLSIDDRHRYLAQFIDFGIGMENDVPLKIAREINRRGRPEIWELVFDRKELGLEFGRNTTPLGDPVGQILAMPIVCPVDIPDEEIVSLCRSITELPNGQSFNFVPTALKWSDLNARNDLSGLLHAMLFKWRTGNEPASVEADIASFPALVGTTSPIDEVWVDQNLTVKLRFLIGYKLAGEPDLDWSFDQRSKWLREMSTALVSQLNRSNIAVRMPAGLRLALWEAQGMMSAYFVTSAVWATEKRHSPLIDEKFGLQIECFGDTRNGLGEWFTVSTYDLETGRTLLKRDIPIVLPSISPRWKREMEAIRRSAENFGCPYVLSAPVLQPTQLNERVFGQTKCLKIILGPPIQIETNLEHGLPLDPNSELPEHKERWEFEASLIGPAVGHYLASVAAALDIDIAQLPAIGAFALIDHKWHPVAVLLLENVRRKDGGEVVWPPSNEALDTAVELATFSAGRKWSRYEIGGITTAQDEAQISVDEIYKSATSGDLDAQLHMAQLLFDGERISRDLDSALQWYRMAALQGDAGAQSMMGYMLEQGMGCDKNEAEAIHWFRLGAENGDAYCQYRMGCLLKDGMLIPKNMSTAIEWFRKASDQGHAEAQMSLALELYHGDHIILDLPEAAEMFRKAALQGEPTAQYNLGAMFAHGDHTAVDRIQAYAWLRLAAEQEYEGAEAGLSEVCEKMSPSEIEGAMALTRQLAAEIQG